MCVTIQRHSIAFVFIIHIIHRGLIKAQVPPQKEPNDLTRDGTDKRVDVCTFIPWECGKSITWNVTIPDTLAQSHLPNTCQWRCCGRCLTPKNCKIHDSEAKIQFRNHRRRDPAWAQWTRMGLIFCWRLAGGYIVNNGWTPLNQLTLSKGFWLSVTLQRHNAIAFRGTFKELKDSESLAEVWSMWFIISRLLGSN